MKRKDGYYWVKFNDTWEIAEYHNYEIEGIWYND